MNKLLWQNQIFPIVVIPLTILLYVVAFPNFNIPESAFIFAIPFIVWLLFKKPTRLTIIISAQIVGFSTWLILLWWLRHVTYIGTILLSFTIGLFWTVWILTASWIIPRIKGQLFHIRILGLLSISGSWVLLEWLRTFIFSGFPWLPLAASQWERPALLQLCSYTGFYGVSFVIIFFNLGMAFYIYHLIAGEKRKHWYQRICPEFYCALALLFISFSFILKPGYFKQNRKNIFRAGVVQPYITQPLKWDKTEAKNILNILERFSNFAAILEPDIILWPESTTPWPINGEKNLLIWMQSLTDKLKTPFLMGNMAKEKTVWRNTITSISPVTGLTDNYYSKRKLVPFGEYNPVKNYIPFIDKFVPLEGEFKAGKKTELLSVKINDVVYQVGPLVCYEDIFPSLSRENILAGADFQFVATNNAWYGEEAGAYQHAAHSVLRAVETRRPVLRCGNSGWSGWIDEYGNIRHVVTDDKNGIYFRGVDVMSVSRDEKLLNSQSVYIRYGNWFVLLCAIITTSAIIIIRVNPHELNRSTN